MSTSTNTAGQAQGGSTVSAGGLFGAGFMGGGIAAVVNLVLLFGAGAAGVAFVGEFQPGQPAAALIFGIIAVVFTLLSLGGPPNVKGLSTGGLVVMELMHVVAAAGIGGMIWRKLAGK